MGSAPSFWRAEARQSAPLVATTDTAARTAQIANKLESVTGTVNLTDALLATGIGGLNTLLGYGLLRLPLLGGLLQCLALLLLAQGLAAQRRARCRSGSPP